MKCLIFDAGPIISLATNNLLWLLEPLKKEFKGEFYITNAVKGEVVSRPLETKKFKFEAIQIEKLIENGVLSVIENSFIQEQTPRLLSTANEIFNVYGNYMKIVHLAEISVIAAALSLKSDVVVIDEKTTRYLLENSRFIADVLRRTLHAPLTVNENNLKEFKNTVGSIKVVRSVELVTVAYERGMLDDYIINIPDAKTKLIESVLWGLKLNGCAVTREEIEEIVRIETNY